MILPVGSTPVDFAYAVHTQIGDAAVGCEINGNESALQSVLRNGDVVKIYNSKKAVILCVYLDSRGI